MYGFDVRLDGVGKRYRAGDGQTTMALDAVSLNVVPGTVVAVTGPSGSGKSTFLHLVGAMDRPDEGTVWVQGIDVASLRRGEQADYRRTIGFVFQRFHLLPALTAVDNVVAPVLPYRTEFDKRARAEELLAAVGLGGRGRSLPSRLSGGEQQRVAIARALVNRPGLLLADEPTGNLDSETSGEIVQLILDLRAQRGMTVLIATHDPLVAARCDRIVSLKDGRIADDVTVTPSGDDELLDEIGRFDSRG